MTVVDFNVRGNTVAALLLMSLPLVIIVVGMIAVRRGRTSIGWRLNRRLYHLPLIVCLALYSGIIYRQFFYDQFYWLMVEDDGRWQFEYYLPSRTETIDPATIRDIRIFTGDLWTFRDVRLVIETTGGREFTSTQVPRYDREAYMNILTRLRRDASAEPAP
jgi:hypothetical protein